MRHIVNMALFLLFTAGTLNAQTYSVASVNGEAVRMLSGSWIPLSPRETLVSGDVVRIGDNSVLSVIDRDEGKIYVLKSHTGAPISEIISSQSRSAIGRFASHLIQSLMRGDTEKISHSANVSYKDLASDMAVYSAIVSPDYRSSSYVSMELVDERTGECVGDVGRIGERFFFRIVNRGEKPVYVNVLDVSSDGSLYDCLPMDVGGTMLHLLVPGLSTVDMRRYPMEFAEPVGTDRFILVAYDKPFDLRNVIDAFETGEPLGALTDGVGVFCMDLIVER